MTDTLYEGAAITIVNRSGRCIHSRHCVLDRPEVFVPNAEGPWIPPRRRIARRGDRDRRALALRAPWLCQA